MPEKNADCTCTVQHYHGTTQCYRTCKCRRQECKDAESAAARDMRKKKAYGKVANPRVDAEPSRRRLIKLMKYGWGVRAISRQTDIPARTLSAVLYGDRGKVRESVTAETEQKILAFNPPFAREARQGTSTAHVAAAASHRKLQALTALGYSLNALAENAGYHRGYFKQIMALERISIERQNSVSEVYDRHWNKLPVTETTMQKRVVASARKRAEENGWRPPMGMAAIMNPAIPA